MGGPSDPMLKWLRALIGGRGLNTAALAQKCGVPRQRLRRILAGTDAMLVDELLQITTALQISPADMGLPEGTSLSEEAAPEDAPAPASTGLDPWGNHVEQLFQAAFTLGCDFQFAADPSKLADSGVPEGVLRSYQERNLVIEMKALYHPYNKPRYDAGGITLTLSFDQLYDCRFPYDSILHLLFLPFLDDGQGETKAPAPAKPHLRLVD